MCSPTCFHFKTLSPATQRDFNHGRTHPDRIMPRVAEKRLKAETKPTETFRSKALRRICSQRANIHAKAGFEKCRAFLRNGGAGRVINYWRRGLCPVKWREKGLRRRFPRRHVSWKLARARASSVPRVGKRDTKAGVSWLSSRRPRQRENACALVTESRFQHSPNPGIAVARCCQFNEPSGGSFNAIWIFNHWQKTSLGAPDKWRKNVYRRGKLHMKFEFCKIECKDCHCTDFFLNVLGNRFWNICGQLTEFFIQVITAQMKLSFEGLVKNCLVIFLQNVNFVYKNSHYYLLNFITNLTVRNFSNWHFFH